MTPDLWTYRASLISVTDGDTIRVRLDLGFHVSCVQSLRLVGVFAPELFSGTNRVMGAKAKQDCADWFADTDDGSEWPWIVQTLKDRTTFGRFLGTIYTPSGDSLNEFLMSRPWQEATP